MEADQKTCQRKALPWQITWIHAHNPCYRCELHSEDRGCLQDLSHGQDCIKILAGRTYKAGPLLLWVAQTTADKGCPDSSRMARPLLNQPRIALPSGKRHDPCLTTPKTKQNTSETSTKNIVFQAERDCHW